MTFLELVEKRYSVRGYQETPVDRKLVEKVLEAGRMAPSACNNQPWHFVVMSRRENVEALKTVYGQPWFLQAPVVIAVCCDTNSAWKRGDGRIYGDVDMAIAMDHMILQATELGLGTCWIGAFNLVEARRILALPDHIEPVIMTPLGYPAAERRPKKRKTLDEIVSWEKYGGK